TTARYGGWFSKIKDWGWGRGGLGIKWTGGFREIFHSLEGVMISNLGKKCYLFKFYHERDIDRVVNSALWTFNNHLLIFHRLEDNKDPLQNEGGRKGGGIWMDLTLRAPIKRVNITPSVWLWEDDSPRFLRYSNGGKSHHNFNEDERQTELRQRSQKIIGFSFKVNIKQVGGNESGFLEGFGKDFMEYDSEDRPILRIEGSPWVRKRLQNTLKSQNPQNTLLMETKLCLSWMEKVRRSYRFYCDIDVAVEGIRGGFSIGWRSRSLVALRNFSKNHIDVEIETPLLEDLVYIGLWFTWERGNYKENSIRKRLDQVVANSLWWSIFPRRERDDEVLGNLMNSKLHLNMEIDKEELYWEQRVRVNLIKNEDQNTTFFHRSATQRQ
ncbi:hypothetical protein Gorai_016456, partial [Gossypium raimondii]|nr:hypothetical protein [Gossypium raimondii]